MSETKIGWMVEAAFYHELGPIGPDCGCVVYPSSEALLEANPYAGKGVDYAPTEVVVMLKSDYDKLVQTEDGQDASSK